MVVYEITHTRLFTCLVETSKSTQSITNWRFKGVKVDLNGLCTMEDFEVIEIVDGTTPYPPLLGLDWEFDNQYIINMKTRKMTFESGEYKFIAPLDPSKGERFVEPTCLDLQEINQLYITTMQEEDYVNPNADGVLS
jgi:hypothetical protein